MRYRVEVSPRAEGDLVEIADDIARREGAVAAAERWLESIARR